MAYNINETTYKGIGNGNVYVLLGDAPVIIDASDRVDSLYIKSQLEELINLDDVKTVLLTHMHYDHSGNVDLFPNAQVYCSAMEIENFLNRPEESLFSNELSPEAIEMLRGAKELGDEIVGLKVLDLPGHTKGSVAYVDEKNKVIFTGDTYFRDGVVGRTDLPNSVDLKMRKSVAVVQKYVDDGYTVCSGHDY